jgi:predicted DNA-binding transcriptional regulator AlpA
MANTKQVLNRKEVQKKLGLGVNKTLNLFKSKSFPSFRIGNSWFISDEALNQWIEEQEKTKAEVKI